MAAGLESAASGAGSSASTGAGASSAATNNPSIAGVAVEGAMASRTRAGAAWGLAAVAAGPDGSAAYNPDEWPRVYGGQAEPHSRILKRCSGSLFAPPLGAGSRPAEGLVGMWLPERFNLAFCDPRSGQQALLLLQPALLQPVNSSGSSSGSEGAEAGHSGRRLAGAAGVEDDAGGIYRSGRSDDARLTQRQLLSRSESIRKEQEAGAEAANASEDGEDFLSSQRRRFSHAHGAEGEAAAQGQDASAASGSETAEDSGSRSGEAHHKHSKKKKKHKHHKHKHHKHHEEEEAVEGAEAAGSSGAAPAERLLGAGLGGHLSAQESPVPASAAAATAAAAAAAASAAAGGAVGEPVDPATLSIELATSRALVVEGGSIRIAWTDGEGDGEGGKPLLLAEGVWARLPQGVRCPQVPYALCQCVGGASGGSGPARGCGMVWRAGGEPLGGGGQEPEGGAVVAVLEVERRVPLSGPALVLAAYGDRAVVALLEPGDDVAAIARRAAVVVRSGAAFTRQLEAAVGAAYAALRPVPRAIGLPPNAPPQDKRLVRKLYDIMAFNTAPGWSTPDRTPHAWKWLWDSCFHAMGMNLINHTAAWEQLKGLLQCQQGDGFIPHMCGDGPPAAKPGTGSGGASSGAQQQQQQQQKDAPSSSLTQPPLLAWAVWDNYLFSRDKARLEWALPRLVKLLNWLAAHRSRDKGLTYFYVHGFESGMDNSPRFDSRGLGLGSLLGTLARAVSKDAKVGTCAVCTPHMVSVDLTALVAREMAHVARMYGVLRQHQDQDHWLDRSRVVLAALAASCWSPDSRIFGDLVMSGGLFGGLLSTATSSSGGGSTNMGGSSNSISNNVSTAAGAMTAEVLWAQLEKSRPRGHVSELVTVAGLVPLLGGRLPRPFLEGLLQHLQDPSSFATRVPLPSVALSSQQPASALGAGGSDMWRGPMWVNMNYLVAVGLREQVAPPAEGGGGGCGALCAELADRIMNRTITEVRRWYDGDAPSGSDTGNAGGSSSVAEPPAVATGTVFEYYDSAGLIPPTRLARKSVAGLGGVRDYHWTAALTLRMMAERAATIAAGGPAGLVWGPARAPGGAAVGSNAGLAAGLGAAGNAAGAMGGSGGSGNSSSGGYGSGKGADELLEEAMTEILDGEEEEEPEQGGGLFGHWASGGGSGGNGGAGRGSLAAWVPHKPLWGEF
ncbi:hypothetical protein HXX76_011483 [Chlamydomonas incerta]|uniref:Mannosylglycerate hydrolase MGH1-like glycoside hydrolase domain-containing protein n=1 Tax=Chlamydomonas incerta TaxID=51695 RepID=A0A835SKJ0_CHLIN|nr:hypothetical protein HXX76_011483 [Chlamydomonas incerta]|eukprot:KAG2428783.1 hypothetical protein HXX76_011483 [Chlamydomonas incerta]